jgi:hypothetical protein
MFWRIGEVSVVGRVSIKSIETEREGGCEHEADEVHGHRANRNEAKSYLHLRLIAAYY